MKTKVAVLANGTGDPIDYGPLVLSNGLRFYPEPDSAIELLIGGAKIFVESEDYYATLFKAFRRYTKRKGIRGLRVGRAQVNQAKWQIIVFSDKSRQKPDVPLESGFVRKRGFYKQLAKVLDQNSTWQSANLDEVKKVMAAWRLYVPAVERRNKRLVCKQTGKNWTVTVLSKD